MKNRPSLGFEEILNATVRMVRTLWKVPACVFLQRDDQGRLTVRAADGVSRSLWKEKTFKPLAGSVASRCMEKNILIDARRLPDRDPLSALLNPGLGRSRGKYVLVPVTGQARVLGLLALGPLAQNQAWESHAEDLRGAGALCAVLSAHWRLYEWMSNYLPQVNHQLRTPLTAVQGSLGMVLGGMFGQVGGEVRQMLEMAHKGCERTVLAIEDFLINQSPIADQTTKKPSKKKS